MHIEAIELRKLEIPMIEPLAVVSGSVDHRETVLVRVIADGVEGWGECIALNEPTYSEEWSDGEYAVLRDFLIPALISYGDVSVENAQTYVKMFKQHHPAKSALEMAILDAELRAEGISLAQHWEVTATSVAATVVIGLLEGAALVSATEKYIENGYRQAKLKITPGHDLERVDLLRREFPDLELSVDANGTYDLSNDSHHRLLNQLDERDLAVIEQPLRPDSPLPYKQLRNETRTPIAIDESITTYARALAGLQLQTMDVMCLKPGMVGGYVTAHAVHDLCAENHIPNAVNGMLETGIARAANLALAGCANATAYPAEVSPDGRWFSDHINTEYMQVHDGRMDIPQGPGIGVEVDIDVIEKWTTRVHEVRTTGHEVRTT